MYIVYTFNAIQISTDTAILIRHIAAGIYFAIFNKRYRSIDFWLPFYPVNIRGIIIQFPRPRIYVDNSIFSVQRINMVNIRIACVSAVHFACAVFR